MTREPGQILGRWGRRAVLFAAFISVASVVGTLLYGSRLVPMTPMQSDSYGYGPIGHHAFAETMKRLGSNVVISRSDRFDGPTAPMLFVEPAVHARVEGKDVDLADALLERSLAGLPTVVVLPKWQLFSGAVEPFLSLVPESADEVLDVALPSDAAAAVQRTVRVKETDGQGHHELYGVLGTFTVLAPSLQVITQVPPTATVLLEAAHGAVVVVAADGTVVVSEPDLIHNYNLARADHAAMWWTLFTDYESDTLVMDEVFHGHGKTHSLGRALGEFPAVLLVCHLLLLLLLLVVLGSRRFGPALPPFRHGHGPTEAIGVAAHVLADGQKLADLVQEYVAQVVVDLADRLGIPPRGTVEQRAEAIDAVAAHRNQPTRALELVRAARGLASGGGGKPWQIARAAHTHRARMLGRLDTNEPPPAKLHEPERPRGEERAA